MGMSISTNLFFGLDLGGREYSEIHYEITNEALEALFDEEWDYAMDTLIDEFAGWKEIHLDWSDRDARSEQLARNRALLKSVGISYGAYSYEYDGHFLCTGDSAYASDYIKPVNFNDNHDGVEDSDFGSKATDLNIENLRRFVAFLETKGFVIAEEHRTPKWHLATSFSY
jgi:hypothetical protein